MKRRLPALAFLVACLVAPAAPRPAPSTGYAGDWECHFIDDCRYECCARNGPCFYGDACGN